MSLEALLRHATVACQATTRRWTPLEALARQRKAAAATQCRAQSVGYDKSGATGGNTPP
jgi:hypothetical protein